MGLGLRKAQVGEGALDPERHRVGSALEHRYNRRDSWFIHTYSYNTITHYICQGDQWKSCRVQGSLAVWWLLHSGPMIFQDPMDLANYLFYGGPLFTNFVLPGAHQVVYLFGLASPGPLLWVGLGILCVSLTTRRVLVAYLGLQIALWMISASFWDPILWLRHSTQYGLGAIGPFVLGTLVLSFVLLALYKPVTSGLRGLVVPQG